MSVFIESLKRLYQGGKLSADKVIELFEDNKITEEEKLYILQSC